MQCYNLQNYGLPLLGKVCALLFLIHFLFVNTVDFKLNNMGLSPSEGLLTNGIVYERFRNSTHLHTLY